MNGSKKILVTGATGLVGARLIPRLAAAGWECRALVRAGKAVAQGFTVAEGDLFDTASLAAAVSDVTAIIHLAAVFRSQDQELIRKSNLEGTRNLIDAAKAHAPGARFIFASTAHVYNADNPHPGREEDAVDPQHASPASKAAAERALQESGLNWTVLRFPFVYGDGDGHLEMLPRHLKAAQWHPAMKMSTIHHQDIATAMQLALSGAMDGRIVNIADDGPATIYELARIAGETLDSSAEPLQHPWHLHVDSSLARSLGFQPRVRTVYQALAEKLL